MTIPNLLSFQCFCGLLRPFVIHIETPSFGLALYGNWNLNSISIFLSLNLYFRITNDAREDEMEENMGQVNTMIGNVNIFITFFLLPINNIQ